MRAIVIIGTIWTLVLSSLAAAVLAAAFREVRRERRVRARTVCPVCGAQVESLHVHKDVSYGSVVVWPTSIPGMLMVTELDGSRPMAWGEVSA